jgi:regulator of protease activity HflC (stomatin/prohibitin superfamily)
MAQINIAQGEAGAVLAVAEATARAIQMVAETIRQPGGLEAVNLRVADRYVDAFSNLAKTNNTLIVPANLGDVASLISTALTVVKAQGVPK